MVSNLAGIAELDTGSEVLVRNFLWFLRPTSLLLISTYRVPCRKVEAKYNG